MDRADATGFGVAFAGHAALLTALSLGLANATLKPIGSDPIEVAFVEEVGLESQAPQPSAEPPTPAPSAASALAHPQTSSVAPPAPSSAVAPRPEPRTAPPARPRQGARGDRPFDIDLSGVNDRESEGRSSNPPAQKAGPAEQASLAAEVRRQLKPHWRAPTGADAELLRTELKLWLDPDGAVSRIELVGTSGQNASNRPQVRLHQEQAQRAVRLASPLRLPPKFYDSWKQLNVTFDRRLSQ